MKKLIFVIFLSILFSLAVTANAIVIDYNEGLGPNPNGPFPDINDYYSNLVGNPVHEGFMFIDYSIQGFDPIYGPHSPWGIAGSKYPGTGIASISWQIGVKEISFWYGYDGTYGPLSVEAYNNEELVYQTPILPQNYDGMFEYSISTNTIVDRLTFFGTSNRYTIDDLKYNPIPSEQYVTTTQTYLTDYLTLGDTFTFDHWWDMGIEPTEFNFDVLFFNGENWETLGWELNFGGSSEQWETSTFWVPPWAQGETTRIMFSLFDWGQPTDPTVYLRNIGSASAPVPEPSTIFLMGLGLVALVGLGKKN